MAMKRVKIFNELKQALEEIRDFRRGNRNDLRVTGIPAPPKKITLGEIRRIRGSLKASQTSPCATPARC